MGREVRTLFTISPFFGDNVLAVALLHSFQEDTIVQKRPAIPVCPFLFLQHCIKTADTCTLTVH
jgi:hypothetical protein